MPKPLRIHTLGRLYAERDGRRLAGAAAQPRRIAVLALLAHAGDAGIARERVLGLLWPDADEERGRRGLYQSVYALRQELGDEDAIRGARELRFDPELVDTDVGRFRALLARGDLAAAVAEYGGPFLDGFYLPSAPEFERWCEEVRTGLAGDHAVALEKLARHAAASGDAAAAVGWWRRLAAHDPLNARTALGLMEALVAAGDAPGALQHARIYEALLEQELELGPDREVVALAERIRAGAVPAPAVRRDEPAPTENRPEHEAPPVPAADASPPPRPPTRIPRASRRWRRIAPVGLTAVFAGAVLAMLGYQAAAPRAELVPGAPVRITSEAGLELDPALSPDGRLVAYAAGPQTGTQLFVRQLDAGARPVAIGASAPRPQRRPRWSPDGTRLAFDAPGGVYVVPALGGPARLVAGGDAQAAPFSPAWSPDGARLAYVVWDTIMVLTPATGAAERIGHVHDAHSLAWSPDGRWIAAVSGNHAFLYGDRLGAGGTGVGNLAPSAVVLVPAEGGDLVPVTGDTVLHTSPEWLDAEHLAVVVAHGAARDVIALRIGPDGRPRGAPVRLTAGLGVHAVSAMPGARRIAYNLLARSANLWTVALQADGRPARLADAVPLTSGSGVIEAMDLSSDGRLLAFDSDRGGSQDIYVIPSGGGEAVPLATAPADEFRPAFSRDGREVAYYSFVQGVRRLFIVPASGGTPVMARPDGGGEEHSPDWAPDGTRIVVHRMVDTVRQLFVLERDARGGWTEPRRLTSGGCNQGRWSPDGSVIACTSAGEIRLVDPATGAVRTLLAAPDAPAGAAPAYVRWSPDGREVFYRGFGPDGATGIWAMPVAGGSPRLLLAFDDPLRSSPRAEFATDGRQLWFTLEQNESDIWTMPLSR